MMEIQTMSSDKIYLNIKKVMTNNAVNGNDGSNSVNDIKVPGKAILDPKRRNDIVDEAFLEQKDTLLDMLEAKLKEVRDKKKKRANNIESSNVNTDTNCKPQLSDVDLNLKANGIVSVGEADVQLKLGVPGQSSLNLNTTGVSNVGIAYLSLGLGNGSVHIPGLDNLFAGSSIISSSCDNDKNVTARDIKDEISLDAAQNKRSMQFDSKSRSINETFDSNVTSNVDTNTPEETTTIGSMNTEPEDREY